MFAQNTQFIQSLDQAIVATRSELTKLEQAKSLLVAAEPVASTRASTAQKKKPGRPALAGKRGRRTGIKASSTDTPTKRGRGRPKGSKNKPKETATTPAPDAAPTTPAPDATDWSNDGK